MQPSKASGSEKTYSAQHQLNVSMFPSAFVARIPVRLPKHIAIHGEDGEGEGELFSLTFMQVLDLSFGAVVVGEPDSDQQQSPPQPSSKGGRTKADAKAKRLTSDVGPSLWTGNGSVLLEIKVNVPDDKLPFDIPQQHNQWLILGTLPLNGARTSIPFRIIEGSQFALRATLVKPVEESLILRSPAIEVHLQGTRTPIEGRPDGVRLLLKNRWYVCNRGEMRGQVKEADAVSTSKNLIFFSKPAPRYENFAEYEKFSKVLTPARSEKEVRIRRHPSRYGDVIGTLKQGEFKHGIGLVLGESQGTADLYVLWEEGGYSRLRGDGGLFLTEKVTNQCETFVRPTYFTLNDQNNTKPVKVRLTPNQKGKVTGTLAPNEVKRAVAMHFNDQSECFVEWEGGGYSLCRPADPAAEKQLVMVPDVDSVLVCPAIRIPPRAPSPEITVLDGLLRRRPRGGDARSETAASSAEDSYSSSDDSEDSEPFRPQRRRQRREG